MNSHKGAFQRFNIARVSLSVLGSNIQPLRVDGRGVGGNEGRVEASASSIRAPFPSHPFPALDLGVRVCQFTEPVGAVTGQLCGGKKGAKDCAYLAVPPLGRFGLGSATLVAF